MYSSERGCPVTLIYLFGRFCNNRFSHIVFFYHRFSENRFQVENDIDNYFCTYVKCHISIPLANVLTRQAMKDGNMMERNECKCGKEETITQHQLLNLVVTNLYNNTFLIKNCKTISLKIQYPRWEKR